jgi:anti-sigma regulatory factor (Ser/Thr protein kinase)
VDYAFFDEVRAGWERRDEPLVYLDAGVGKLNRENIERLLTRPDLADLYFEEDSEDATELVLDLRHVDFVEPYALTTIPALCEAVAEQVNRIWVCLPKDPDVKNYCGVSGLIHALKPVSELVGESSATSDRVENSKVLVALTRFETESNVQEVVRRAKPTLDTLLRRLRWPSKIAERSISSLIEVAMNVVEHAGSVGFLTLQAYQLDRPDPFLVVSVSDCGVGVRSTLEERYPSFRDDSVDDAHVLMELFRRYLTSREGQKRGKGIQTLRDAIKAVRGRIHFRSGCGFYRERSDREQPSAGTLGFIPGTHIRMSFDAPG